MELRIGTRKSKLALIQTDLVIEEIKKFDPTIKCTVVPITTTGDVITNKNLYDIGGKALFLKEIEIALLNKSIDIAVHSLKDVPGRLPEGLELKAVLKREDPRDAFICNKAKSISELPVKSVIGSSSVRRRHFIKATRPDIEVVMFRGNVVSRLDKLMRGEVDATILALAGLNRMEAFKSEYCFPIPIEEMLPAVGQGVLTVEILSENKFAERICGAINDKQTWNLIQPERAFLEHLDANCRTPIAAYTEAKGDTLYSKFMLSNFGGDQVIFHEKTGLITKGKELGYEAAEEVLAKLPDNFIQSIK